DPTMVAVKGAGEVPAYTGIAYIVMTDDETREGEYAQFEFVVAKCGERTDNFAPPAYLLVTGAAPSEGQPLFSTAKALDPLEFAGISQSTGADLAQCVATYLDRNGGTWMAVGPEG